MWQGIEGQHYPGYFIDPGFGRRSFQQACMEHVIQGPMASLVDCVALRMIGWGEDLLDPKGAQELGPDGADEFLGTIGEEPVGCAKIRNNMAHKSADCIRSMVAGADEDGILQKAIHEGNQELVAVIQGSGPTMSINSVSQGPWDWIVPAIFWRWP